MSDLVEFLRARIDEDAQMARKTSAKCWHAEIHHHRRTNEPVLYEVHPVAELEGNGDGGVTTAGDAEHIARHDPARVLREVEAKRRILDEVVDEATSLDMSVDNDRRVGFRDEASEPYLGDTLLRLLANPYVDHPDYRSEWAP
jgi:hypothetical protein